MAHERLSNKGDSLYRLCYWGLYEINCLSQLEICGILRTLLRVLIDEICYSVWSSYILTITGSCVLPDFMGS